MEDGKEAANSARAPSVAPPPPAASTPQPQSNPPKAAAAAAPPAEASVRRQRFSVELRPGETTIVSWKKLLKESAKSGGSSADPVNPDQVVVSDAAAADPAVQPAECELKDAEPPPNRFSAVIEKIERLYMGKQSSDEDEPDDIPDDQYDTEDSFIDDAELDEYFQVDKLKTKHDGYFVNKGKLEGIELSSEPSQAPRKRRRKDSSKMDSKKDHGHIPSEPANMSNMRVKAAARNAPLAGRKSSTSAEFLTASSEHYQDGKHFKTKLDAPSVGYKKKSSEATLNLENPLSVKASNKDGPSVPLESNSLDKRKARIDLSRDFAHKSKASESIHGMHHESRGNGVSSQAEFRPKKLSSGENQTDVSTKIRQKEKSQIRESPNLSSSAKYYPMQAAQSSSMRAKEGLAVRPKGTTLERAIRDLEKVVAESRPPHRDNQEVDTSSPSVKRRLPQEIKQKLGKVARLSASQGKLSEDEITDRLMSILGHLVQRKTLKRNIKEMVELGLSAKQQKFDRFQQIKKEVHEMIRTHVSQTKSKVAEQQDGSPDDFQEVISNDERKALKGRHCMDRALEDKICDLYDLYMEGMDEDKGPQSRKLYVQLSELWPSGYMDNLGIKDAIYKSKERKRALHRQLKVREEERTKRKRMSSSVKIEETGTSDQVQAGYERPGNSIVPVAVSQDKLPSNQVPSLSARLADSSAPLSDSGHHLSSNRSGSGSGSACAVAVAVTDPKKKIKRKAESDIDGLPAKLSTQQAKEKSKSRTQDDESNADALPHSSPQLPGSN